MRKSEKDTMSGETDSLDTREVPGTLESEADSVAERGLEEVLQEASAAAEATVSPAEEPAEEEEKRRSAAAAENVTLAYLQEMKDYKLISYRREQELGRRIKEGQQAIIDEVLGAPVPLREVQLLQERVRELEGRERLPKSKERVLLVIDAGLRRAAVAHLGSEAVRRLRRTVEEISRDVDEARQEMIKANLRLVITIAKGYTRRGLSFADLIQEGNLGLMKAVDRYDYTRGHKFSTYATWWIRQSINRAIYDKAKTIRVPVHIRELRKRLYKVFYEMLKEYGREPTPEEVAERAELPLQKVVDVLSLSREPISLETPVGEEGSELGDFIENKESVSAFQATTDAELVETTRAMLDSLSPREEKILRLRYGIGGEGEHTLEEIGRMFNVSRERIRQIEKKALNRLRQSPHTETLHHFLEET
jgi:RNA polymerase primary sigma factor